MNMFSDRSRNMKYAIAVNAAQPASSSFKFKISNLKFKIFSPSPSPILLTGGIR